MIHTYVIAHLRSRWTTSKSFSCSCSTTVPSALEALSYPLQRAVVSAKNEVSSQKIGPKVFHKGDYSEEFLSRDIVRALGFTECATPVSYHAFLAVFTPLRQNRPNTSFAGICVEEKRFELGKTSTGADISRSLKWSTQHVQSAGRAASRSLRNPERTDGNIQLVPESVAPPVLRSGHSNSQYRFC